MTDRGTDLVILAGGQASRLGTLCLTLPKALLPVAGIPFIAIQVAEIIKKTDVRRVVVMARRGTKNAFDGVLPLLPVSATVIEEPAPLGTGGAILSAAAIPWLSNTFLAVNGDVLFRMDAKAVAESAKRTGAALAVVPMPDTSRFGRVDVHGGGQVTAFREKSADRAPGQINAGLYAFTKDVLAPFPVKSCSFERDIAPVLAAHGQLGAVQAQGPFIDIGTPHSYAAAAGIVSELAR